MLYIFTLGGCQERISPDCKFDSGCFRGKSGKEMKELGGHILAVRINPEHMHRILSLQPAHHMAKGLKGSLVAPDQRRGKRISEMGCGGYGIRTVSEKNLQASKEE